MLVLGQAEEGTAVMVEEEEEDGVHLLGEVAAHITTVVLYCLCDISQVVEVVVVAGVHLLLLLTS